LLRRAGYGSTISNAPHPGRSNASSRPSRADCPQPNPNVVVREEIGVAGSDPREVSRRGANCRSPVLPPRPSRLIFSSPPRRGKCADRSLVRAARHGSRSCRSGLSETAAMIER
jgi:hypothetical protein